LPYLEDYYGRLVALFDAAATERQQILTWMHQPRTAVTSRPRDRTAEVSEISC